MAEWVGLSKLRLALESDPARAGLEPLRVTRSTSRTAFSSRFRGEQKLQSVSIQEAVMLAEGVGFEPTVSLTPRSISSRVP